MTAPIVDDDPAYQLLRQERVDLFNEQKDTLDLGGLEAWRLKITEALICVISTPMG
ncbi:MAG: hypothetical protein P8H97_06245 [Pseudomonadales bacterium]|nr:hypothetical protein [Pseudomonadales bacterium]MDG2078925.1 hypothetical protein [Pseudomonadales bacterium]